MTEHTEKVYYTLSGGRWYQSTNRLTWTAVEEWKAHTEPDGPDTPERET